MIIQHVTSTPPRPMANVSVQLNGQSLSYAIQNVVNRDPVIPAHDSMTVTLTGRQPELEALFLNRYNRAVRMTTARRAREARDAS